MLVKLKFLRVDVVKLLALLWNVRNCDKISKYIFFSFLQKYSNERKSHKCTQTNPTATLACTFSWNASELHMGIWGMWWESFLGICIFVPFRVTHTIWYKNNWLLSTLSDSNWLCLNFTHTIWQQLIMTQFYPQNLIAIDYYPHHLRTIDSILPTPSDNNWLWLNAVWFSVWTLHHLRTNDYDSL